MPVHPMRCKGFNRAQASPFFAQVVAGNTEDVGGEVFIYKSGPALLTSELPAIVETTDNQTILENGPMMMTMRLVMMMMMDDGG